MQVRRATATDMPAMIILERATPSAAHWRDADYTRVLVEGRIALVMEDKKQILGFVVVRELGPEWEIENVVVAVAFRRKGLGSHLMAEVLKVAQARGAQSLFLEVRDSNVGGRAFYKEWGFIESGRRRGYYQDPEEDAVVCKKFLSPEAPESC